MRGMGVIAGGVIKNINFKLRIELDLIGLDAKFN